MAPTVLAFVMASVSDRGVMLDFVPAWGLRALGWSATLVMAGAAVALGLTLF